MKKQKNTLLIIAAVACVISVAVMVFVLTGGQGAAEFTPPPFDVSAQTGIPAVPEELGWSELDAQAFRASVCGRIIPVENTADIWLTNPERNTVWLKLRILDEKGKILGETGLIRPGEYVRSVTLDHVPKSGTPITLKLMAYQPDTYYSEGTVTLNTAISGS